MHKRQKTVLLHGKITFRSSGKAVLYLDKDTDILPKGTSVVIPAHKTGLALPKDLVEVLVPLPETIETKKKKDNKIFKKALELTGTITKVLERSLKTVIGTLRHRENYYFVCPDDPRIPVEIVVPDPKKARIKPTPILGDKVSITLEEWENPEFLPSGKYNINFGATHSPSSEFHAILHKYGLCSDFTQSVEYSVSQIPDSVSEKDIKNRLDIRKRFTFTIDPDDAKDFDDALSFERIGKGSVRVGVHIADVNAYVPANSTLDSEARRRGNSTYLVGTVIPMLPHKLSSGLCSLKEGVDRLTKSVFFVFNKDHHVEKITYANTVIHSKKRLTYGQALALLREDNLDSIRNLPQPPHHQTGFAGRPLKTLEKSELEKLQRIIRYLWQIAQVQRKERIEQGSLDLDMPEVKIYVDTQGWTERIEKQTTDESHQLIEEFMLMANQAVAQGLKKSRLAGIHRVHDLPDPEKLAELGKTVRAAGISVGDLTQKTEVSHFLEKIRNHPQEHPLKVAFLRSLRQANYSEQPIGHYGLGKQDYLHFTSPIRRYADLIVHRVFEKLLQRRRNKSALQEKTIHYRKEQLAEIAEHISITEQNSVDAERESIKVKLLEFYDNPKNKAVKFDAIITDVKNRGLFVEMADTLAFGFVPFTSFLDDHYHVSSDGTRITGTRYKRTFSIGQIIPVTIKNVDRFKREIDLAFADNRQKNRSRRVMRKQIRKNN